MVGTATILAPHECPHERRSLRRKTVAGGSVQFRFQCLDCGAAIGSAVKQQGACVDGDWDEALEDAGKNTESEYWSRQREAREAQRERERDHYANDYLRSEQWRQKRELVLKRDNGLCQACLRRPATQVHHKTYSSARQLGLGNEPAFDLVSVCDVCHTALHPEKHLAGGTL